MMDHMLFEQVGSNIRSILSAQGRTQQSLAEELGISKQVMSKIIAGAKAINAAEIRRIADALHVSADSLLEMPATDGLQKVFERMLPGFQEIFGKELERVVLYGSYARGTAAADSDVDIALIVRGYTEKMHDRMIDLTVDLELDCGKVLSVLLIERGHFEEWGDVLPFYRNVKEEGITLWSAA
ncbi:MAG: helix-turn-helix domain-containing protein [Lachnospiraceae bacterium]|nr:helix-turn-helix domain-containing protein [Lachnospiraceae bacterium]